MKTKDKILFTARTMFNEHGYGNVTLAMLASELKIAKGNIWYHYNDKRAILTAINEQYIELYKKRAKIQPELNMVLDGYVQLIQSVLYEIRQFRFMFRDQSGYGEHSDTLKQQLPDIYKQNFEQFTNFLNTMRSAGHLKIDPADIKPLVYNLVLVLRYGLEFAKETGRVQDSAAGQVHQTFLQHMALYKNYLSTPAYDFLISTFSRKLEQELQWAV